MIVLIVLIAPVTSLRERLAAATKVEQGTLPLSHSQEGKNQYDDYNACNILLISQNFFLKELTWWVRGGVT